MTRRDLLGMSAGAALVAQEQASRRPAPHARMGVAETALHPATDSIAFLEWADSLGAAGIQARLSSLEPDYIKRLRARAEQLGMYIEVMGDLKHLEQLAPAAREAGATVIRFVAPGSRRYEAYKTLDDWKSAEAASRREIAQAIPIAQQARVALAIENHRDRTLEEMIALQKEFAGDWFGVTLDTGNNIALLDDPMEVIEKLAPYALSTHVKDMGLRPYPDGFLLDEVPFGSGVVDLPRAVAIIARARPHTRFTMEMLTRNPTPVDCLSEHYWRVLPDRTGEALARTLRVARDYKPALPQVDGLTRAAQAAVEEETIRYNFFRARGYGIG